ncbi:MAG TPA: 16S rRNA (adenine(1518)-N(6)/adenine(1519)-N(6))-dimethyltransferase RsmA [Gammaproteobacteria bacterium]|nr:16S rRNA (adenine(1518)-N(6)/adenine(1519)-N(6))-dimethyltransferase RsmA [Gammaproteobacteria bacterium]
MTTRHRPRKRFGQHFLHDPAVIRRIVAAIAPAPGERLVEIGPGLGALTIPLLEAAGSLEAVEIDRDVIPLLQERCRGLGALTVHEADALTFDFAALAGTGAPLRLVGNLPYNISTPLLFHLLAQRAALRDMHFMLQKEVVDRMCALPATPAYGRLTVMLAAACRVESLFHIGRGAFTPPPRVDSAFVRLVPYSHPPFPLHDERLFAQLVARAFSKRRKTLRNALKGLADEDAITAAGLDPGARPETLAARDYAALAERLAR